MFVEGEAAEDLPGGLSRVSGVLDALGDSTVVVGCRVGGGSVGSTLVGEAL